MTTKNFVPRANGEGSIGTTSKKWGDVQADHAGIGNIDVSGNITVDQNLIHGGATVPFQWNARPGAEDTLALTAPGYADDILTAYGGTGNIKLKQNIYLAGTDASIRTADETAFIIPKNTNGDYWQRAPGAAYNDATVHIFRNADGSLNPLSIASNGNVNATTTVNVEIFRANGTASVTDLTPFVSYMDGDRRFRVNHTTTDTSILLNGGGVAANEYSYIGANASKDLILGTNGRNMDLALNAAGTEMSHFGSSQNWNNRLIFGYNSGSGHANIKAYSTVGSTKLKLGTSLSGSYSTKMEISSNGAVGINGTPSGDNWLEIMGTGGDAAIYAKSSASATSPYIGEATHASFTGTMMKLNATRTQTSAFYFAQMLSSAGGDIEFTIRGDGNAWADGSWNAGGADFAEYFEWADGNPNNEDRRGWAVVLENGKIRKALAPEIPFGVISARPTVVGDAAEHKWADKYLKDDFNKYIMEDYEVVEWTETKVVQDATEAVYQTVTKECEVQATETITEDVSSIELIDGNYTKVVKTETKEIPLFDEFDLYEDGQVIGVHSVPRMVTETYDIEEIVSPAQEEKTEDVQHSYAVDEVPDGVVVPVDATRSTQQRRKLNPDYDENQEYIPRSERSEWDCVGLMGKLRLVKGEVVNPNWIKMRDISDTVEEWLIIGGGV